MFEFSHLFDSLVTISTPHIGITEQESSFLSKGIGFVTGAKKLTSVKELYLDDDKDLRNTFIYNLSEDPGMGLFKNILLFHSSNDIFCPSYSSRIQSNKTMKYFRIIRYGGINFEMIDHILAVVKCKHLHRIDIIAKLDKTKLLSVATKAIPADILRHKMVADYIAWRLSKL